MYDKNIIMEVLIMPRYKLSPEERAAEKERKENLRNIMKGLDVKNFDDLKDVFRQTLRYPNSLKTLKNQPFLRCQS